MRTVAIAALLAAGCSGDGPGAPSFTPRAIELSSGAFTVGSGSEVTLCKYVDLPVEGDYLVSAYHAEMLPGSHHFNMFWADPIQSQLDDVPRDELAPCVEVPLRIYMAGSQWREVDQAFPPGVGLRIPAGSVLILEIHYANYGDFEIEGKLDVRLDEADPAALEQELGLYFNVMQGISVEPGQRARLSARCPVAEGAELVVLTSHMHHFGEAFEINLVDEHGGATPIYLSEDWSHPILDARWEQPIPLHGGQSLEWACTYRNPGPDVLVGGASAEENEMCVMAAFYLPNKSPVPYCFREATIEVL